MLKLARTLVVGAVVLCAAASSADAGTITFSNTSQITIPVGSGTATPYPSNIAVAGFTGGLTELRLTLTGLTHTWPSDIDLLLVGPTGAALVFMSDAGSDLDVSNITLTFSDAAASPLSLQLTSGTFRPTDVVGVPTIDVFPAPAPASFALAAPQGSATFLSIFGGLDPNGVWSLYAVDDTPQVDGGQIAGGWSLTITAPTDSAPVPEPTSMLLLGTGLIGAGVRRYRQRRRP